MKICFLYLQSILLVLSFSNISHAKTGEEKFQNEISETFFESGKLSKSKLNRFLSDVKEAREDSLKLLTNYYVVYGNKSYDKARAKAESKTSHLAYDRMLELIELMKNSSSEAEQRDLAAVILDIGFSLKTEGRDELYENEITSVRGYITPYKVNKKNNKDEESYNLIDSKSGKVISQDALMDMKRRGIDISKLNPSSDGQLWTDHDIESYQIKQTYLPNSNLYKGSNIQFPQANEEVNFDDIKKSQNRPKFTITKKINGEKRKFKVKLALEMHGEATAASLYAALGFNTDASKYYRNLKVRFKDGEKREFLREFKDYFQMWEWRKYVSEEGTDSKGDYVVLKEALLEARDDSILRAGPWGWSSNGNASKREIRALALLNVWVGNYDLKESAQNRILLKKGGDPEKRYYISSDLGWVFGSFLEPERPGSFPWNPVLKKWGDSIRFKYYGARYTKALSETTWDDARWTVRLMSRLSRTQIEDAVKLGGWPEAPGKLLVEKIISRRNVLVEIFDLENEVKLLPFDRHLTTKDGFVKNGKLKKTTYKGYERKYGLNIKDILNPIAYGYEESFLFGLAKKLSNKIDNISYEGQSFDNDLDWGGTPIFKVRRRINENDQPYSGKDTYLVHDQIMVGFALSTGKGLVSGDAIYFRSFNLIYPVEKKRHGLYEVNYLAALMLPYSYGHTKMPEKYALFVEDVIEGRGSLNFYSNGVVDLGPSTSLSKVVLKRQLFVDKGQGKVNALEDHSAYNQLSHSLRTKFANFDFPVFEWLGQKGNISRDIYEVKVPDTHSSKDRLNYALEKFFSHSGKLDDNVKKLTLKSDFVKRTFGFNLFNYVFAKNRSETHKVKTYNKQGEKIQEHLQLEKYVEEKWNMPILTNSNEDHVGKAFYYGVKGEDDSYSKPIAGLNFKIKDSHTSSKEINDEYVSFANIAANEDDFLPINADLFNHRRNWGTTLIFLDFLIYESGIEKLLDLDERDFEAITGATYHRPPISGKDEMIASREDFMTARYRRFFNYIFDAKNSTGKKRASNIVKALRTAILKTKINKTFRGDIIGEIVERLSEEDFFFAAKITVPGHMNSIFPNEKPVVNQKGTEKYKNATLHRFYLTDSEEIYNFFDTLEKIGSITPSKDEKW